MSQGKTSISKRSQPLIRKIEIFKEAAVDEIKNSTELDKKIVEEKSTYREKISSSHTEEYKILAKNMEKADTPEERQAIRDQMESIRKDEREEAKDFNEFADNVHGNHHKHSMQVLGAIAITAGLVKFRKPIMDFGKSLISLKA